MARPGVTKGQVGRARLALMKAGKHPSIDAVRIELGNTGSKGTISAYLREIEADEGGVVARDRSVSEEVQTLVANLAERLEAEAQAHFDGLKAGHVEEVRRLNELLAKAQGEARAHRTEAEGAQTRLGFEKAARQRAEADLAALRLEHGETSARLTAQVSGLQSQLAAAQAQVMSLEEKHTHARESLEHFRAASREQRDRELRQHEQQLQHLQRELATSQEGLAGKQAELRATLQEKVDALALLTAARAERRQVDDQLRALKPAAERLAVQNQRVEDLLAQIQHAGEQYETLQQRATAAEQRNAELELLLAAANASAQSQADMVKEVLGRIGQTATPAKSKKPAASEG